MVQWRGLNSLNSASEVHYIKQKGALKKDAAVYNFLYLLSLVFAKKVSRTTYNNYFINMF